MSYTRANIRMIRRRRSTRLAPKPLEGLRVGNKFIGQKLQRHMAAQADVFRPIHRTHAPAANFADDLVVGNLVHERREVIGIFRLTVFLSQFNKT